MSMLDRMVTVDCPNWNKYTAEYNWIKNAINKSQNKK